VLPSESSEGLAGRAAQVKSSSLNQSFRQGQRDPLVAGAGVGRQRVRIAQKFGEPGPHLGGAEVSGHRIGDAKCEGSHSQMRYDKDHFAFGHESGRQI